MISYKIVTTNDPFYTDKYILLFDVHISQLIRFANVTIQFHVADFNN